VIDFLTKLLFESLPLLLVAEIVAVTIALAVHRRRFTSATRHGLWITLVICGLLIVVQCLVVTDREQLEQLVEALAQAVDDGDVGALGERLDSDFQASLQRRHQDKQAFLADVNVRLQRWQVNEAKVFNFRIDADGNNAVVAFSATCDWRSGNQVQYNILSLWKLQCVRRLEGWKLSQIISAKIGPGGMLNLTDAWAY